MHFILLIHSLQVTIQNARYYSICCYEKSIKKAGGNCSDLTQRRFRREGCQTLMEGIEVLGHPGAKEGGKSHAGLAALGATSAATNFAGNHQWTNAALGQVVVGRNPWNRHKDKQLG